MADARPITDGPTPFDQSAYDFTLVPDYNDDFVNEDDIEQFAKALAGPDNPSDDLSNTQRYPVFITALNDWRPVYQRVRRTGTGKKRRKTSVGTKRGKDETREGFVYGLLKWPLLILALSWILVLALSYLLTRFYIIIYENFVTLRGKRDELGRSLRKAATYDEWIDVAQQLDKYLGNNTWKETDEYAYYNSNTVRTVRNELRRLRTALDGGQLDGDDLQTKQKIAEDLKTLVEASVKNNFVGVENARLYSESFYGTKDLVQSFFDEAELSIDALNRTTLINKDEKVAMYRHISTSYGRTALCLSGGATFAYYHFGVAKALLDAAVLPEVITGTSGGALVAALLGTRTDEELKKLLVPALAYRINACSEPISTWFPRWWRTGARFDSVDWARRCGWFCRGSLTFREAYERTGRILNVTCIPSDPHSPTVLANYLTAPDCVIWSAVLASAAVPGILNPVVLMKKTKEGPLIPYSFGHKWKDGSLRTDIPLKALNTHFNVNFSIVSQVNPHINLFFFSSRGTVGRPVTHRRGRGWRGGFLGSATEQYLKLDLTKWLKVLRHLELLPRYMGQDWSEVWLQRFSGTVTIWPRSRLSDFAHILSDPNAERLAHMIHVGQQSTFPKLKFIANRMKVERPIEAGRREGPDADFQGRAAIAGVLSEDDLKGLLEAARKTNGKGSPNALRATSVPLSRAVSPSISRRWNGWWSASARGSMDNRPAAAPNGDVSGADLTRRSSVISEIGRQTRVFFDDEPEDSASEIEMSGQASAEHSAEEWDEGDYTNGGGEHL